MPNIDISKTTSVIPTITGNSQLDTMIRYFLLAASAAITAIIVTWLNAHGFTDPNLVTMISGAVFTALVVIAVFIWGFIQNNLLKVSVVNHVIATAVTGKVTPAVKAIATPAQEILITEALNAKSLTKSMGV